MNKKIHCLLIFGGRSDEHKVSVHTAKSICQCSEEIDGIEIQPLYISQKNEFFLPSVSTVCTLPSEFNCDLKCLEQTSCKVICGSKSLKVADKENHCLFEFDVIYPLIVGASGESGEIYGLLSMLEIPHIGPDLHTSLSLYDKHYAKLIYQRYSVPSLPFEIVYDKDRPSIKTLEQIDKLVSSVGIPCILKPARQGSSIGLQICSERKNLKDLLRCTFSYDKKIIIEPLIQKTEYCCYAWRAASGTQVSQVMSITPRNEIYDYTQKYINKSSVKFEYFCDSDDFIEDIRSFTDRIYTGLEGKGIWRFDFFIEDDKCIWINEINTVPSLINAYEKPDWLKNIGVLLHDVIKDIISVSLSEKKNKHTDSC